MDNINKITTNTELIRKLREVITTINTTSYDNEYIISGNTVHDFPAVDVAEVDGITRLYIAKETKAIYVFDRDDKAYVLLMSDFDISTIEYIDCGNSTV